MHASFTNIVWKHSTIYFDARLGELNKKLWIQLPNGVHRPEDDLIAGALATLVGPNLASLTLELTISPSIKASIEEFCSCPVEASVGGATIDWRSEYSSKHAVSFSGGFDSLAAHRLLPQPAALVSMDFGGWFQRETDFFSSFDTNIVSTNFRMEGFGRRSWMFMLSGIILLKKHLDIGSFTTGSILESSPWHYRRNIDSAFKAPPFLQAYGLDQINTTIGITEVCTTLLSMRYYPDQIVESLKSLAAPGTGKSLRKRLLIEVLALKSEDEFPGLPEVAYPDSPPLVWGQSLTDDMLTPYLIKNLGIRNASRLMAGIPAEIETFATNSKLNFYERYHPGLYNGIPADNYQYLMLEFAGANIYPFNELDWTEYRALSSILSYYHEIKLD